MKQDLCQSPPQGVRPQPAEGVTKSTKRLAWGEGEGKERKGGKQGFTQRREGGESGKILTGLAAGSGETEGQIIDRSWRDARAESGKDGEPREDRY